MNFSAAALAAYAAQKAPTTAAAAVGDSALAPSDFRATSSAEPQSGSSGGTGDDAEAEAQLPVPALAYEATPPIVFAGAGLAYAFTLHALSVKFGADASGSEHQINNKTFDAELQLVAFNAALYASFGEAASRPHGVLAVAVLVKQLRAPSAFVTTSGELAKLAAAAASVKLRNRRTLVAALNVSALLSDAHNFVTYDGSLTSPPCAETVTWLVLNKPLYVTKQSVSSRAPLSRQAPLPAPPPPVRCMLRNTRGTPTLHSARSCARVHLSAAWTRFVSAACVGPQPQPQAQLQLQLQPQPPPPRRTTTVSTTPLRGAPPNKETNKAIVATRQAREYSPPAKEAAASQLDSATQPTPAHSDDTDESRAFAC